MPNALAYIYSRWTLWYKIHWRDGRGHALDSQLIFSFFIYNAKIIFCQIMRFKPSVLDETGQLMRSQGAKSRFDFLQEFEP
jgi:hypothetical protein